MMKINNEVIKLKTKTITIKEEHEEYIKEKTINLSRFVQKALDERMKSNGNKNK